MATREADCPRHLYATVLNEEHLLQPGRPGEKRRPFAVQKLRLDLGLASVITHKVNPVTIPQPITGDLIAVLDGEGPHQRGVFFPLPPEMQRRLGTLIGRPPTAITRGAHLIAFLYGLPKDTVWKTVTPGELYEPLPGQAVAAVGPHGTAHAIYLGEGMYLTWADGIAVCDGRSLRRRTGSDKIEFLVPQGSDVRPQFSLLSRKPYLEWKAYAALWKEHFAMTTGGANARSEGSVESLLLQALREQTPAGKIAMQLGFREVDGALQIPDLENYLRAYDRHMNRHIARGKLTEADVFRFGRAFRNWRGDYHFCRWNEKPPRGFYEIDSTRVPEAAMAQMIGMGLMPISCVRAFHDTRHYEGFLQFPVTYMKPLRAFLRSLAASPLPRHERDLRVFYAFETLSLVPEKNWESLKAFLPPMLRESRETLITVDTVYAYYQFLPFHTFAVRNARKLLAALPALLNNYSGARDESLDWRSSSAPARENPQGMADRLSLLLDHYEGKRLAERDPHESALVLQHGNMQAAIAYQLSRLQVLLRESTRVTPTQFFAELAEGVTRPGSRLHRMFLQSGATRDLDGAATDGTLTQSLQRALAP